MKTLLVLAIAVGACSSVHAQQLSYRCDTINTVKTISPLTTSTAVIVKPDGSHAILVKTGNISNIICDGKVLTITEQTTGNISTLVRSDGKVATVINHGTTSVIVNPDGTHSTMVNHGGGVSIIVNPDGTHTVVVNH